MGSPTLFDDDKNSAFLQTLILSTICLEVRLHIQKPLKALLIRCLADALRMFFATFSNIIGAVILIAIILPYFLIAVTTISLIYFWAAMFYRASARELKVSPHSSARRQLVILKFCFNSVSVCFGAASDHGKLLMQTHTQMPSFARRCTAISPSH